MMFCSFSLRTLLIAVLLFSILLAVPLSLARYELRNSRVLYQQSAFTEQEAQKILDSYGWSLRKTYVKPGVVPIMPKWVYETFGIEFPEFITYASLSNAARMHDGSWGPLHRKTERTFHYLKSNFGNKELRVLLDLPFLETLDLRDTAITDQGLRQLRLAKNLKFLSLSKSNLSKEAIETLRKNLPQCKIVVE